MPIESDVYVKFGDDPHDPEDYPLIEGDCTDFTHFNWCELRSCGFNLTVPDHSKLVNNGGGASSGGSGSGSSSSTSATPEKPKTKFDKVTLKKRVDWASTQLFLRCCEAGKRKIDKARATEQKQDPTINVVTVHICKSAGFVKVVDGESRYQKFPFIVILYRGVVITDYKIDMSSPEPEETVTIEFDSYEFEYQPTDPSTGLPFGERVTTGKITRDEDPTHGPENPASPGSGGGGANSAASVAAQAGIERNAVHVPTNIGTFGGPISATDTMVETNFPGLLGPNGLSILPN